MSSGDLVVLRQEVIRLPSQVFDFQCVAQTTKRRRCTISVEGAQQAGWRYVRHPADAETVLSVYDLSFMNDDETDRWRAQHCVMHHKLGNVTDFVGVEWRPFNPDGYVWTRPARCGGWTDSGVPFTAVSSSTT